MKQKFFTALAIFFETLYFLVITYTLSSMAASFPFDLFGILCRIANIFAITQYYTSMKKHTGNHFWTYVLLFISLAFFAWLTLKVGYVKGAFTPFPRLY